MPATRKRFMRPDTHAVFLEDEGGIAYLYDITLRAAILERGGADFARRAVRDIAEGAAPDSAVSAIGKEGLLLVIDLGGDGGLAAEIAVGPALDRKELKANPGLIWKKPQVAKLALRNRSRPSWRTWATAWSQGPCAAATWSSVTTA
jgi:hypothetical protein